MMTAIQTITVTGGPVSLHTGHVRLTPAQYETRKTRLQATQDEGIYAITQGPINFKVGETFGLVSDQVPKALRSRVKAKGDGENQTTPPPPPPSTDKDKNGKGKKGDKKPTTTEKTEAQDDDNDDPETEAKVAGWRAEYDGSETLRQEHLTAEDYIAFRLLEEQTSPDGEGDTTNVQTITADQLP